MSEWLRRAQKLIGRHLQAFHNDFMSAFRR
jgi:hypothetical protein